MMSSLIGYYQTMTSRQRFFGSLYPYENSIFLYFSRFLFGELFGLAEGENCAARSWTSFDRPTDVFFVLRVYVLDRSRRTKGY